MSVPELERTKSRFEVVNKCWDLCVYTIQITKNENVFTPEFRDITNGINRLAVGIYVNALTANGIYVTDADDYNQRHRLQTRAIEQCNELLALINIAKKLFHLKSKRMAYWSDKITTCRDMLKTWRTKDKQRYGS